MGVQGVTVSLRLSILQLDLGIAPLSIQRQTKNSSHALKLARVPCFSRQMLPMTPYLSNLEVTYLWQSFHRVQYQSRPHQQHFCNTSRLWSGRNSYCWTVTSSQIVTVQTETERRGPLGRELLVWFGAGAVLVHFGRLLLNSKSIDFVANVKLPVKIFCLFLEGNRLECFSSTFKWHV